VSNILIVVNCTNIREAQRKLESNSKGTNHLPHGAKFGFGLLPFLEELEAKGQLPHLAKFLNERGLVTPAGKRWGPVTVSRLMATFAEVIRESSRVHAHLPKQHYSRN
jgi:hypothetical protein